MDEKLDFYSDDMRHLVCYPYSVENLHKMAEKLDIKRCWYHKGTYPHYDIPKRRITEIHEKTIVVDPRVVLLICKGRNPDAVILDYPSPFKNL